MAAGIGDEIFVFFTAQRLRPGISLLKVVGQGDVRLFLHRRFQVRIMPGIDGYRCWFA